ncbi:MAG TPA: hypothetical protein VHO48_04690 [Anaerolineaceae bacterium]|nr:hypothetical protein [Anaerolineaceae bacterium]
MKHWSSWITRKASLEVFLRVAADAVLVNVAIIVALVLRLLAIIASTSTETDLDIHEIFWLNLTYYRNTGWLITILCMVIF